MTAVADLQLAVNGLMSAAAQIAVGVVVLGELVGLLLMVPVTIAWGYWVGRR